jgi:hypothetical protein
MCNEFINDVISWVWAREHDRIFKIYFDDMDNF